MMRRVIGRLMLVVALGATSAQALTGLDVNGQCVGDANGDSMVTINELITAVNNALGGCPQRQIAPAVQGDGRRPAVSMRHRLRRPGHDRNRNRYRRTSASTSRTFAW